VEVEVEEAFSPALIEQVNNGALDLAVVSGGTELADPPKSLATFTLLEEELVFVEKSSDDVPADTIPLSEVANRRLVLSRSRHGFRSDLERAAATCGLVIAAELEINAPGPLFDLVAHGNLSTVVPETTARRAMEHLPLRLLRIVSPVVTREVVCVHRKDRPLSGILLEFVEIVRFELGRGVDAARRA
jgi:LysR family nitrogen assimilation transcriptional regulator